MLANHIPYVFEIRHAHVKFKYRECEARYNNMTETQISEQIAIFFNHSSDISRGYTRLTFDSLSEPLATKRGITSSTRETPHTGERAAPLAPIRRAAEIAPAARPRLRPQGSRPSSRPAKQPAKQQRPPLLSACPRQPRNLR